MKALILVSLAALLPACPSDESCGPSDALGDGLVLSGTGVEIRYHDLVASPNNDCPDASAPAGVVSLTISGTQVGGSDAITFCVPRPDLFADPLPLDHIMQSVFILAGHIILFLGITLYYFNRKDILN